LPRWSTRAASTSSPPRSSAPPEAVTEKAAPEAAEEEAPPAAGEEEAAPEAGKEEAGKEDAAPGPSWRTTAMSSVPPPKSNTASEAPTGNGRRSTWAK
jgi:hypothetical protein